MLTHLVITDNTISSDWSSDYEGVSNFPNNIFGIQSVQPMEREDGILCARRLKDGVYVPMIVSPNGALVPETLVPSDYNKLYLRLDPSSGIPTEVTSEEMEKLITMDIKK